MKENTAASNISNKCEVFNNILPWFYISVLFQAKRLLRIPREEGKRKGLRNPSARDRNFIWCYLRFFDRIADKMPDFIRSGLSAVLFLVKYKAISHSKSFSR